MHVLVFDLLGSRDERRDSLGDHVQAHDFPTAGRDRPFKRLCRRGRVPQGRLEGRDELRVQLCLVSKERAALLHLPQAPLRGR